jgi:hypothetical protein
LPGFTEAYHPDTPPEAGAFAGPLVGSLEQNLLKQNLLEQPPGTPSWNNLLEQNLLEHNIGFRKRLWRAVVDSLKRGPKPLSSPLLPRPCPYQLTHIIVNPHRTASRMVADALVQLRLDDARETDRLKIILGVDYGTTFTGKFRSFLFLLITA